MQEFDIKCHHLPGEPISREAKAVDTSSHMTQKFAPINNICEHVIGIHFYSGRIQEQLTAHHFCSVLNEDFRQCLIYDSNESKARLIGVEYIISEKLFKSLPDEETKYWHSHIHDVKSGVLTCPNMPLLLEKEVMKTIINTYGKTIHFWQIDKGHELPLGPPQLMMVSTQDNQIDWNLVKKSDEQYGSNIEERRQVRANIEANETDPRADAWDKTGIAAQFYVKEESFQQ